MLHAIIVCILQCLLITPLAQLNTRRVEYLWFIVQVHFVEGTTAELQLVDQISQMFSLMIWNDGQTRRMCEATRIGVGLPLSSLTPYLISPSWPIRLGSGSGSDPQREVLFIWVSFPPIDHPWASTKWGRGYCIARFFSPSCPKLNITMNGKDLPTVITRKLVTVVARLRRQVYAPCLRKW